MSRVITVNVNNLKTYDIVMEQSFDKLYSELLQFDLNNKKVCIVSDTTVSKLYEENVKNIISGLCNTVITYIFEAGEKSKNLDTVNDLYEILIKNKFDRHDFLIALGGGVVGDLCGFAAATYLRGIDFIQLPTTLLSQVDSSIGGKTGVDFKLYKNMIGAFHMPRLVYTNIATLMTLTDEQYTSGMGEVIKHGLIADKEYFNWIKTNRKKILERDMDICEEMIYRSDIIKKNVVETDPTEKGIRAVLNYGHTLGHAIEKLMDFSMLHGHCVALGSLAAAYISEKRGYISEADCDAIKELFKYMGIPVMVKNIKVSDIIEATKNDKKMSSGIIKFILLKSIGNACIDNNTNDDDMILGLKKIII